VTLPKDSGRPYWKVNPLLNFGALRDRKAFEGKRYAPRSWGESKVGTGEKPNIRRPVRRGIGLWEPDTGAEQTRKFALRLNTNKGRIKNKRYFIWVVEGSSRGGSRRVIQWKERH